MLTANSTAGEVWMRRQERASWPADRGGDRQDLRYQEHLHNHCAEQFSERHSDNYTVIACDSYSGLRYGLTTLHERMTPS